MRMDNQMKRLKVLDTVSFDSRKWYEDADGNVRVPVVIAQAGILEYKYRDGSGNEVEVKEVKLPEEILSKHTLFSAEGKPVTWEHPSEMVDSTNYFKYAKGTFINPKVVGDSIHGEILIYDKELQNEIKTGNLHQISPGFWSSTEYKSGEYNGDKYDAIQRDIQINHIAIVKEGRAGNSVRIKLDSKEVDEMKIIMNKSGKASVKKDGDPEKKVEEYQAAKDEDEKKAAELMKSEKDADTETDKEKDKETMPDKKDQNEIDIESLPEPVKALIQQLMAENEQLKRQGEKGDSKTSGVGSYMEAREFALKHVADTALELHHDSATYYMKAVIDSVGVSTSTMSKPQIESAYKVARASLETAAENRRYEYRDNSEAKTETEKALKKSEESNKSFTGKRKVLQ